MHKLIFTFKETRFLKILINLFIVALVFGIIFSVTTISISSNLQPQLTTDGWHNFLEMFDVPLKFAAALLAVITLDVTLLRMKQADKQLETSIQQLESSYQPELFIEDFYLYLELIDGMYRQDPKYKIYLYNVGRAVAKRVTYTFSFDVNKVKEKLDALSVDKPISYSQYPKIIQPIFDISYEKEKVIIRNDTNSWNSRGYTYEQSDSFKFILSDNSNNRRELKPPQLYFNLLHIFSLRVDEALTSEFVPLKCTINYYDLKNKPLGKTFIFYFKPTGNASGKNLKNPLPYSTHIIEESIEVSRQIE